MSEGWASFFQRWITTTLGVLLAAAVINGVSADTVLSLLAASLLLGVLNAFIRPVLMVIALPLLVTTLGLFTFVINALLLLFGGNLVKGFHVVDFWAAFKGALLISIVSLVSNLILGKREVQTQIRTARPTNPRDRNPPPDTGSGPIIDV